jgi:hypothetical protein
MKKRLSRLMFLLLCIYFVIPFYGFANPQPRDIQIVQELGKAECARHSLDWSDVCDVGAYHSRSAAVSDALSRAEASHYKKQQEVAEPVVVIPQQNVVIDAPAQPPQILPKQEMPAAAVEPDRMVVVDEALSSYQKFQERQNALSAGVEVFTYKYEEEMFMEEKGTMYGVFVDYRYRSKQNQPMTSFMEIMDINDRGLNILMLDGRFSAMTDGHYKAWEMPLETYDNKYFSHEFRMMGGYELPIQEKRLIVMPYAGFGFRYLLDDGGGKVTPVGEGASYSYDRESRYIYIPLGIETRKFYNRGWSTKLTAEYDWLISGMQKSHLPIWDGGTVKNFQPSGYGIRGSFRLAKEIEAMEFFVEPFARYWHISDSKIGSNSEGAYVEPRNVTQEYGARLGVRF